MKFKEFLKEKSNYKHLEVSYKKINHPLYPYAVYIKGKSGPVAFFKRNYNVIEIYNRKDEYKGCCKNEKYIKRFVRSGKLDKNIYYIKKKIDHTKFTHAIFLRGDSSIKLVYLHKSKNKYIISNIESEKEIGSFSKLIDCIRYIHDKISKNEKL